jgi:hypothetical protein
MALSALKELAGFIHKHNRPALIIFDPTAAISCIIQSNEWAGGIDGSRTLTSRHFREGVVPAKA